MIFNRVYIVILTPIGPLPALLACFFSFCLPASLFLIFGQATIYRAAGLEFPLLGLPSSSSSSTCSSGRFNLSGVGSVLVVDGLAQQASPGVPYVIRNDNRRRCATQEFTFCSISFPSSRPSLSHHPRRSRRRRPSGIVSQPAGSANAAEAAASSSTRFGRFNLRGVEFVLVVDGFVQQASPGVICVIRNVYRRRRATQNLSKARHLFILPASLPFLIILASSSASPCVGHRRRALVVL